MVSWFQFSANLDLNVSASKRKKWGIWHKVMHYVKSPHMVTKGKLYHSECKSHIILHFPSSKWVMYVDKMKFMLCAGSCTAPVTQWVPRVSLCKQLGKNIGNIVPGQNVLDHNLFVLNHFANEVVVHVDVLCVWNLLSFVSVIMPWLSQFMISGSSGTEWSSHRKLHSHRPSLAVCICVMYSASVLDSATTCCFFELHKMAPAPMWNE